MSFSRQNFFSRIEESTVTLLMQQGVPFLDADWNENDEVRRHELYDGLSLCFSDGVEPGSNSFRVEASSRDNDFSVQLGRALINGRPYHFQRPFRNMIRYSTQPWTDPEIAQRDGVELIEPLQTPTEDHTLFAYLDVFNRVVTIDEFEPDAPERQILENRDIGLNIETCIRVKREAAVRVIRLAEIPEEGEIPEVPEPDEGHFHMPLALLHRLANDPRIAPGERGIEDIRPALYARQGIQSIFFLPNFLPSSSGEQPPWELVGPTDSNHNLAAVRPSDQNQATGILPLNLPDNARLSQLNIMVNSFRSEFMNSVSFQIIRFLHQDQNGTAGTIDQSNILVEGGFVFGNRLPETSQALTIPLEIPIPQDNNRNIVKNSRYFYSLFATSASTGPLGSPRLSIFGISINYFI